MTDYPRYEQVKGSPDSAYRGYHGARLVSLVFGLVDRWRGKPQAEEPASALDPTSGPIEVHERLTIRLPSDLRANALEQRPPLLPSQHEPMDHAFSGEFIVASARPKGLQTGLFVAFVVVLVVMVAQASLTRQHANVQAAPQAKQHSARPSSPPADQGPTEPAALR